MERKVLFAVVLGLPVAVSALAQPVDLEVVTRIRQEAIERSRVMATARYLTDEIGPRLTGSPGLKRANEWTREQLEGMGLSQARLEPFDFGDGWSFSKCQVRVVAPFELPLAALPEAWTPGTEGLVRGEVARVALEDEEDLEQQKGKLVGKIVFLDDLRTEDPLTSGRRPAPTYERHDEETLEELSKFEIREPRGDEYRARMRKRIEFGAQLNEFLAAEGVLAVVRLSSRDYGILRLGGPSGNRDSSRPRGVASVVMAAEPYQRIVRMVDGGDTVELELEVEARFLDQDRNAYNTLAEIPGGDRRSEVVIAGAHLDSWHAGTGATDDAAGSAVVLEAARILSALGVKPRRTIRFALWGGEEQGLLGSRSYVERHVADRPEPTDPEQLALPAWMREKTWPLRPKPEHAKISAYFNIDNGGGRIRGIYTQGNVALVPIFESWLAPLRDLEATTVTNRSTGSTDHVSFDEVGVPGFQFVQDPLDYTQRTHHSNLDTFERLHREDLVQASIVLATFLWQTANRAEMLPRKPMPQPPPEEPETKGRVRDGS